MCYLYLWWNFSCESCKLVWWAVVRVADVNVITSSMVCILRVMESPGQSVHSTITRVTPDAGCWLLRLDTELQILHSYPAYSWSPRYRHNEWGEQVSAVMGSNKTGPRRQLPPCPLTPPCYDIKENFCELCLSFYNSPRITFQQTAVLTNISWLFKPFIGFTVHNLRASYANGQRGL